MMNRKSNHLRHPGNQPTKNGGNHMETMKNHHVPARGISIGACGIRHLKSAHFYTGVPPVSPCALRESLPAASECGRQAGGKDAFGVSTGIFPSLQGLRPLRRFAAIL